MATKYEHKFRYGGVSNPNEREGRAQELNKDNEDGWTIVTAEFTPGGVFYALLKRPVVEEKK